jgi:hypothetical protein
MNTVHGSSLRALNLSSRSLTTQIVNLKSNRPNRQLPSTIRCTLDASIDRFPTRQTYKLRQVTTEDVADTASLCLTVKFFSDFK